MAKKNYFELAYAIILLKMEDQTNLPRAFHEEALPFRGHLFGVAIHFEDKTTHDRKGRY